RRTPGDGNTATGKEPHRPAGRNSRSRSRKDANKAASQRTLRRGWYNRCTTLSIPALTGAESELAQYRGIDPYLSILRTMAQQVIHQHQSHHGFGDRRGADTDTGIVPTLGHHL